MKGAGCLWELEVGFFALILDFFDLAFFTGGLGVNFSMLSLRMFMPVRLSRSQAAIKLSLLKNGMLIVPSTYL